MSSLRRPASSWSRSFAPRVSSIPRSRFGPCAGQIDDLLHEIRDRAQRSERVLVTTLTKRMAEDLAGYYSEVGVRCRYMHSEIETLERVKLLRDLRKGEYDVLIGINLLREGLDLPEVSLVAILDADKEGFLRSSGSLIQTMGRAARHISGRAILYADKMTDSMKSGHRTKPTAGAMSSERTTRSTASRRNPSSAHIDMSLAKILQAEYADLAEEVEEMPEFESQEELDELHCETRSRTCGKRRRNSNSRRRRSCATRSRICGRRSSCLASRQPAASSQRPAASSQQPAAGSREPGSGSRADRSVLLSPQVQRKGVPPSPRGVWQVAHFAGVF